MAFFDDLFASFGKTENPQGQNFNPQGSVLNPQQPNFSGQQIQPAAQPPQFGGQGGLQVVTQPQQDFGNLFPGQRQQPFSFFGDIADEFKIGIQPPSPQTPGDVSEPSQVPIARFGRALKAGFQEGIGQQFGALKSILKAEPEERRLLANRLIFNVPLLQEERAQTRLGELRGFGKNEPIRLLTDVGSGILGTAEGFVGAAEWAGVDKAKPIGDKIKEWRNTLEPEDRTFVDSLASGVGSAITFFVPGFGTMKGATLLAKVSPLAARWFGATASAFLESATEAGAVYREMKENGASDQEASTAAGKDFWVNAIIVSLTNKLGIFGEQGNAIKRALMSSGVEGIQEVAQQITSNVLTGRPWDQGVLESGAIGAIIGGGIGVATPEGIDVPTQITPRLRGLQIEPVTPGGENIFSKTIKAQERTLLPATDVPQTVEGVKGYAEAAMRDQIQKFPQTLRRHFEVQDLNTFVQDNLQKAFGRDLTEEERNAVTDIKDEITEELGFPTQKEYYANQKFWEEQYAKIKNTTQFPKDIRITAPIDQAIPQEKFDEVQGRQILAEEPIIPKAILEEPTTPKPPRPPSLRELGLEEDPNMITRREDILLRARIRDQARGAKIGAREARVVTRQELISKFKSSQETVAQIQDSLVEYIKDKLPPGSRGKFIQSVLNATTKKGEASVFARIEREVEQIQRKEIVKEVKEVPNREIAVDYQKKINDALSDISFTKPSQAMIEKLNALKQFIREKGDTIGIPKTQLDKLENLSKKSVKDMSTEDLIALRDNLKHLEQLGRVKLELKMKYDARAREAALKSLIASTRNVDPKGMNRANPSQLQMAEFETKRAYMNTIHTPRVADMIDDYQGYKGENAKYVRKLGELETEAKLETQKTISDSLEKISEVIPELTEEQQIRIMIRIREMEGAYDQVETLLDKYGFKEVPKLTSKEERVIEILERATTKNTDKIAAVYEELENQPFEKIDRYILPLKYEKEFNVDPKEIIQQGRFRKAKTTENFVKGRQLGVERTPRVDVLGVFEEAINEQEWYLKMQPELENLRQLVKSEEYTKHAGELASRFWSDLLDVVARRGWSASAKSNPMLSQARINLNQAILGYKLSTILLQPFALFDAMAYSTSRYGPTATLEIMKEFTKAWVMPKYAKQIIEESPALQLRQGGEVAIEETLSKLEGKEGLLPKFVRNGMALIRAADVRTAAGVREGILKILEKRGVPDAASEADFIMNLTQGSADVVNRPLILSHGEGARTWFTFQTFFLNRWGVIAHDLIRSGVLAGPGWKDKLRALIGLGIVMAGAIAEGEARRGIKKVTTGKAPERENAFLVALRTIPEAIPYFGNIIEATIRDSDSSIPVIRVVENLFRGTKSAITGKKLETKIKGGLKAVESVSSLAGIPGTAQFFELLRSFVGGAGKDTADEILEEFGIDGGDTEDQGESILKQFNIQ